MHGAHWHICVGAQSFTPQPHVFIDLEFQETANPLIIQTLLTNCRLVYNVSDWPDSFILRECFEMVFFFFYTNELPRCSHASQCNKLQCVKLYLFWMWWLKRVEKTALLCIMCLRWDAFYISPYKLSCVWAYFVLSFAADSDNKCCWHRRTPCWTQVCLYYKCHQPELHNRWQGR